MSHERASSTRPVLPKSADDLVDDDEAQGDARAHVDDRKQRVDDIGRVPEDF